MPRWTKITLISVAVIFALLLLSMLVVPWQIKKQGSAWVAANTERTLSIEKVFFNPFALTLEVSGVNLTEQKSEQPFVTFDRLMLSVAFRSIIDQAIILDRVELDNPFVNIELLGKQEFNFSDFTRIGSDKPKPPSAEPAKPFYFSLNNIILTHGSIDFTDQTSEKKSQHKIREFDLSVPFVGNIPYLTDQYVQPQLSMLLNGSLFKANGQLKPFNDSLETNLYLTLSNVDLSFYAFHSPVPLPIEVKQGILDCELDLAYRISSTEEPKLHLGGELALSDIDLRELNGRKLFSMPTLVLDLDWADLFKQDINLTSLDIYNPQLYIDRDNSGQWNFQRILKQLDSSQTKEPKTDVEETTASDNLPLLFIEKLALQDGMIHFRDDFVNGGFSEKISAINLELNEFSTHPAQKTITKFNLQTSRDLTLEITGTFGISPSTAILNLTAGTLLLEPLSPYLESFLTAPVTGILGLSGQLIYTQEGSLQLRHGELSLQNLHVPFYQKDHFTLSTLSISDSTIDLQKRQIDLGTISLLDGDVRVSRLADGSISPLKLLKEQPEMKTITEKRTLENAAPNSELPWNISVGNFDLQKFKLLFTDHVPSKHPQIKISRFDAHAKELTYPTAGKSPFSLAVKIGQKGAVDVAGTVIHTPLQLETDIQISDFSLADFNDFIPDNINLNLKSGKISSHMTLALKQQEEGLTGHFSGKSNLSDFNLRDPLGDGKFLAWENLNVDGIQGEIDPFALQIKEVALSNYQANIQITKDGRINLTSITAEKADEEKKEVESKDVIAEENIVPPPDIRIDALTLQGGTVSFIDRSMISTFNTTMYELGGRVTGMSSDEQMQADVDLRGQLESHSPLTITGKINPLSKNLFADLTISFKDIDLTPMTPYSGTFLGYAIGKGKLYLDLNYHIEDHKIKATNKIMIDQFTLGDTIESDKATSLPIGLAIALLKDSNEEIHLDVPIYGDLEDPSFSIAGVVFTVIKNLIVKAATSPFSLLSAMLGSGNEDFTSITFTSGLATIDENQLKKLQGLAEMLAQRPSLNLEISAFADKKNDPESYRQEQLRQMLVAAKWRELEEAGNTPESKDEIVISEEEYPDVILTVYKQADFPRPKNFIGMLKKLPVEEMEKLLLANILAGEEQITALTKARTQAVRSALIATNEKIKERIFLTQSDMYQLPEEGPASRVEFTISAK